MENFFNDFDWKSFWMGSFINLIFLIISIFISIKLIPYFTLKLLKKKRKKNIITKVSYVIQEFCQFIEKSTFKSSDITNESLSIYTNKKDIKNYRFIGITNLNVFKEITHLRVQELILEQFEKLTPDEQFEKIKKEKERLDLFSSKLEAIINSHSLDLDEEIISDVSQLCIQIRALDIKFNYNNSIDDLIEKGLTKRTGIFGISETKEIYVSILAILKRLLEQETIEVIIK
ncbi:MAG: hypothetical protein L6Q46_12065 [Flavobacterium sp.]|uniref:hypothetical protein n=1 Tax=Flavobacterium sp. TaxID=239 RepID=UPI0025C652FF|nr:hypothetical protein [Flavobacterium sp.]MCK6609015.1 hypothetical protein [Flavobacterium sp.]